MNRILLVITIWLLVVSVGGVWAAPQHAIAVNELTVVAANNIENESTVIDDMPMGQSAEGDVPLLPEEDVTTADDDLFGVDGGYFHPYLSLEGAFTDNLFNVDNDKTSTFYGRVSPGIWVTLPRKKIIPITIAPHNTSPGGLQLELDDFEGIDRFQLYALAGTDFYFYSEDSELDSQDVALEGMGRYNMASGLSLQLLDRYSIGHDDFGFGSATDENLREFDNNLLMATIDWDLTEKLRFKFDYSNFQLNYEEDLNAFLERVDNAFDLYGYFKYSVKTSFFLQYRYTDIEYDSASTKDNSQDFFYGGIRWDTTEKLALLFKAGLQLKEYEEDVVGFEDSEEFVVDFQALYRFSQKVEAALDFYRKNEESDSFVAAEKVVFGLHFDYTHEFTEKITGKLYFNYENAEYDQLAGLSREDDSLEFKPAIQYLFKEWLMGEIAYSYDGRDSSEDIFDYDTNTFFFSLNVAF